MSSWHAVREINSPGVPFSNSPLIAKITCDARKMGLFKLPWSDTSKATFAILSRILVFILQPTPCLFGCSVMYWYDVAKKMMSSKME